MAVQTRDHNMLLPIPTHILWVHQLWKNLRIFLAIRYIAGRAMAKNWLLKFGFKLKNCKFQEEHPSQALFLGFFFFKSSNQKNNIS